ncbi:hypothetical protein [Allorhizobium borbori]|uniref:Uncharacterized protein n=1 Tax=Allorhizobium borbori TaxID=485907 RepID=A0A7W6NZM0_9HYPH|nr:hypothetical protein [Allorhizobium borbori]MBB4102394.1 hypothetical protein [Allorhizobium borbori]
MGSFATKTIFGDPELIPVMPLDTANAQIKLISSASHNADFVIPDGIQLVEIVVIAQIESADIVNLFYSDNPAATPALNPYPVGPCSGTSRLTYAIGESRDLSIFLAQPATGSAMVAILGA